MEYDSIEKWVQKYLRGEGNNIPLADGLLLDKRFYLGPILWDILSLERCCGPEHEMKYHTNEIDFNRRVNGIIERIINGWEMPALIVNYENGIFTINDGNHRHEACKRLNIRKVPVIFWITKEKDFQDFKVNKLATTSSC